jgi:hypothetical protein
MDSDQLTAEQAGRLYAALFPHVNYPLRLLKRMHELRFRDDDAFYRAVREAFEVVWRLRQEAHSMSTQMGRRERR